MIAAGALRDTHPGERQREVAAGLREHRPDRLALGEEQPAFQRVASGGSVFFTGEDRREVLRAQGTGAVKRHDLIQFDGKFVVLATPGVLQEKPDGVRVEPGLAHVSRDFREIGQNPARIFRDVTRTLAQRRKFDDPSVQRGGERGVLGLDPCLPGVVFDDDEEKQLGVNFGGTVLEKPPARTRPAPVSRFPACAESQPDSRPGRRRWRSTPRRSRRGRNLPA